MEQNSEEWLKWRLEGIGASDAPAIMGVSDYLSAFELWQIKTGKAKQKVDSFITNKGHKIEDQVRALYEMDMGKKFLPCLVEFQEMPWLRASLDGRSDDGEIIEIKMVGKERYESKELTEAFKFQATQQMFVGSTDHITFLFARTPDKKKNVNLEFYPIRYERENSRVKEWYRATVEFKQCVDTNVPPDGVIEISDKSIKKLILKWKKLKIKQALINKKVKAVKDLADETELQIEEKIPKENKKSLCAGYYLERDEKQGTIDWDKVPKDLSDQLEKYRKASKPTFEIKKSKVD